jgi:hypothetical protein
VNINAGGAANITGGTWNQSAGSINVAGAMTVSNGTVTVTGAGNGVNVQANGSLLINGGGLNAPFLTRASTATFTLKNGTVNLTGPLDNGGQVLSIANGGSDATLNLSSSGTTSIPGLLIGTQANATGILLLNSGVTLNTGASGVSIGGAGVGYVYVYGGTWNDSNIISLNGNNSSFYMTGGSVSTAYYYGGGTVGQTNSLSVKGGTFTTNVLNVGAAGSNSVYVTNGGTLNGGNALVAPAFGANGSLAVTGGTFTATGLSVGGDAYTAEGTGTVTIAGGSATVSGAVTIWPGSNVTFNGGTLTMASLVPNGGSFYFNAGTVNFSNSWTADSGQVYAMLGAGSALGSGRTVTVTNALTLSAPLSLSGGTLNAGSLTGGSNLLLNTGALNVTGAGNNLTVGTGTIMGPTMSVGTGMTVATTGNNSQITINNGGLVLVSGGTVSSAGGITNSGEIQLAGPASTVSASTLFNFGRLDGTGRVTSNLTNGANGVIAVDAGQRMVFAGSSNANSLNGTISLTGGTVEFTGSLTNNTGGFISGRGTYRGSSANTSGTGLINSGVLAFSGGVSDVFGKVNNTSGGQIITAGGGVTTFHDDVVHNGAEIRTSAGARTVFFGAQSGASPFTGTGTVEYQGDLRPGNSPAWVHYEGDVVLDYSARTVIELAGTTPGLQYDRLDIAGTVSLGGEMDVVLLNGFMPSAGQRYDVVDFGQRVGQFDNFTGLDLGNGLDLVPGYDAGHVFLQVSAIPEPTTLILTGAAAIGGLIARRRRAPSGHT